MSALCKPANAVAVGVAVANILLNSWNAAALTAQDVTEKMSRDQRFGYLAGLIDMSTYRAALDGNATLAKCIHDAFYTDTDKQNDPWRRLDDALRQFSDKRPESIVVLLIQKMCGG